MTLEGALRIRARRASRVAASCLLLAVLLLVAVLVYLPSLTKRSMEAFAPPRVQVSEKDGRAQESTLAIALMVLSGGAAGFAAYLLGQYSARQLEISIRFVAIADALCISDEDFARFEKAVPPADPRAT